MPLLKLRCPALLFWACPQTFDRGSFGIGALTTNRYQPTEKVGDPLPSKVQQEQQLQGGGAGSGAYSALPGSGPGFGPRGGASGQGSAAQQQGGRAPGGPSTSRGGAGGAPGSGRPGGARPGPGAPAGGLSQGLSQGYGGSFMPFAMPTYAIPDAGRAGRRAPTGYAAPGGPTSQSDGAPFTQAPRTQTQMTGLGGASQALGNGGTFGLGGPLTQAGGGPGGGVAATSGLGAGMTPAFPGDFSQRSYAGGAGGFGAFGGLGDLDDFGAGEGVGGGVATQYDTLLSQGFGGVDAGASQAGYGGFIDPSTGEVYH